MTSALIDILTRGHESKDFDYKGPMAWDEADKRSCCELVKDILGMPLKQSTVSLGCTKSCYVKQRQWSCV